MRNTTKLRPPAGREVAPFTASDLITIDDAPTVRDIVLAERLGFAKPLNIRELIRRNREEVEAFGGLCHHGTNSGKAGGRPGREFYLNSQQAMLVTILSKTSVAAKVRRQMIEVFDAATRDATAAPAAAPVVEPAGSFDPVRAEIVRGLVIVRGIAGSLAALLDADEDPVALPKRTATPRVAVPAKVAPSLIASDSDLLYRVSSIAAFLGLSVRVAAHQVYQGEIPTFKMGRIVCARRSTLLAWLAAREADAIERAGHGGSAVRS